jgi:hypothetical protein
MAIEFRTIRALEARNDAAEKTDISRLEVVVDQVRRDSRENAEGYLDETTVPHGGE